jgi:uncharacterized protein
MTRLIMGLRSHPGSDLLQVGLFWCGYLAILFLAAIGKSLVPSPWKEPLWGTLCSLALLLLTRLFLRRSGRTWSDVGLQPVPGSLRRIAFGLLLGAVVYGSNLWILSTFVAPIRLVWNPGVQPLEVGIVLLTFMSLSVMEELGFRAFPLRTLIPALGPWKSQAVVALAFGLCHIAFGWSWSAVLTGVIPSALLFGAAAAVTRGLAMAIGVHAGVNIARWLAGENHSSGPWAMVAEEPGLTRLAAVAPFVGIGVTLVATVGLWIGRRNLVGRANR